MAFPGTYNISYYKGDTYEFNIYPKDSNGQPFDLTGYTPVFTIATSRGPSPTLSVEGYALIPPDASSLRCAILPADAAQLAAGSSYVYDIQISKESEELPYPLIYTLLTGNITVTSDVTGAV
jgi:hypothetical protein